MELAIISRDEARAQGVKRYFTGELCRNGHLAPRATVNATCIDCQKDIYRRCRERDPVAWRRKHAERCRRHMAKHPDFHAAVYERHKEKIQARVKRFLAARPDYKRAVGHRRNERIKLATPHWLTDAQRAEIVRIYEEAAARPGGPWHVDHIVPLQGRTVCGLHVPWNLQILTKAENLAKGASLAA